MAKHGKRYAEAKKGIVPGKEYHPLDAVRMVKGHEVSKFDSTIEVHFRLGVNVRHAEEQLRGTIALPHGTGADVKVAVFAQGDAVKDAEAAGADVVGGDDLAEKIKEGFSDFDVVIATPDMMGTVGKLGRVLGPQGKMPNPKSGTVTPDVATAISEIKAGKVEYRTDRHGIVHMTIGKRSFEDGQLAENYQTIFDEILRQKPASSKGVYFRNITMCQTQGPGVLVDPNLSPAEVLEAPEAA